MPTAHATAEAKTEGRPSESGCLITVSGERNARFQPFQWRMAIRQYLACIWTERFTHQATADIEIPTFAPQHGGGGVILRYDAVRRKFSAFGSLDQGMPPTFLHVRKESVLAASALDPDAFQLALARFAWNKQLHVLGVNFQERMAPRCHGIQRMWIWAARPGITVFEEPQDEGCLGYGTSLD